MAQKKKPAEGMETPDPTAVFKQGGSELLRQMGMMHAYGPRARLPDIGASVSRAQATRQRAKTAEDISRQRAAEAAEEKRSGDIFKQALTEMSMAESSENPMFMGQVGDEVLEAALAADMDPAQYEKLITAKREGQERTTARARQVFEDRKKMIELERAERTVRKERVEEMTRPASFSYEHFTNMIGAGQLGTFGDRLIPALANPRHDLGKMLRANDEMRDAMAEVAREVGETPTLFSSKRDLEKTMLGERIATVVPGTGVREGMTVSSSFMNPMVRAPEGEKVGPEDAQPMRMSNGRYIFFSMDKEQWSKIAAAMAEAKGSLGYLDGEGGEGKLPKDTLRAVDIMLVGLPGDRDTLSTSARNIAMKMGQALTGVTNPTPEEVMKSLSDSRTTVYISDPAKGNSNRLEDMIAFPYNQEHPEAPVAAWMVEAGIYSPKVSYTGYTEDMKQVRNPNTGEMEQRAQESIAARTGLSVDAAKRLTDELYRFIDSDPSRQIFHEAERISRDTNAEMTDDFRKERIGQYMQVALPEYYDMLRAKGEENNEENVKRFVTEFLEPEIRRDSAENFPQKQTGSMQGQSGTAGATATSMSGFDRSAAAQVEMSREEAQEAFEKIIEQEGMESDAAQQMHEILMDAAAREDFEKVMREGPGKGRPVIQPAGGEPQLDMRGTEPPTLEEILKMTPEQIEALKAAGAEGVKPEPLAKENLRLGGAGSKRKEK
jgi:hypothetical protein